MTSPIETPENADQKTQIRWSFWRALKVVIGSKPSERIAERIAIGLVMVIVYVTAQNVQLEADNEAFAVYLSNQIEGVQTATILNRCIGLTIVARQSAIMWKMGLMSEADAQKAYVPAGCIGALDEIRQQLQVPPL